MAAKVTLNVVWGGRRETVRVAANTTLAQVRDQVCAGWGVAAADAAAAVFAVRKRALDMALPLRLAGLASGQTLDLVFAGPRRGGGGASSAASSSVVAVQLPSGVRVQGTFPGATSVWDVLCDAERKAGVCVTRCSCGGGQQQQQQLCYAMPVVVLLGRETAGDVALRATSLAQLGAASGPVLLRVLLRPTQEPLSEALARIDAGPSQQQQQQQQQPPQQQDLAPAAEATTTATAAAVATAAQTPTPPMPAAAELVLGDEERRRRIEAAVEDERRAAERAEADALETRRAMAAAAEARRLAAERQRTPTPPQQQQQRSSVEARAREREARLLAQWQLDDSAMAAEREQEASEAAKAIAATLVQNAQASAEVMQQQAGTAGAAEKDVPEEERGITVYPPSDTPFDAAAALADIPDSFYELTADDLSEILAEERRTKAEASVLMTREMRERIRAKHWNQFKRCNIRVRFPDQVEIQRTFLPRATISEVEAVVRACLANSDNEFVLFTAPPVQHLSDKSKTLLSLHFVPAALLHLKWKRPEAVQHPFLKADLMGRIAERLPPNWSFSVPTAAAAASSASTSAGPRCAGCLAAGLPLVECVECDNSFCAACWSQVHQDERASHHRRSKTTQQTTQQQDEPKQKRKLGVPTWFSKGRRF